MTLPNKILALGIVVLPPAAWGADYVGLLKPPKESFTEPSGLYSFTSASVIGFTGENKKRLTLGYKYSRYFSIESEYVDFTSNGGTPFSNPANLASAFRSTGFGVDTIATLPVWNRFSFYGRLGAYRGEARDAFSTYSASLLGENAARGTRLRYGLGVRYEFTNAVGIRAGLERYSPLGSSLASDPEADLVSVGVMWRF